MSVEILRIRLSALTAFVVEVLQAVGVQRTDAAIITDCLLAANLSGVDSHGIVRLAHYVRRLQIGSINARPVIEFERLSAAVGRLDGGHGLGHIVGYHATSRVMELAEATGAGAVSVQNSSHFGMAGHYATRLARHGYIGMCMTPSDRLLIPHGASAPFFGSNPICFGFPMEGEPVVLDMATTTIPYGRIALAAVEGEPIPGNWGVDAEGNPTTDAERVVGLHPVGGPKGSGLAMAVDIFSSVLARAAWGPNIVRMYGDMSSHRRLSHFFAAWDVRRFMPLDQFMQSLQEMCDELNALTPARGYERVCYAGQLEGERREERRSKGIPLSSKLFDELVELGESLGIALER